MPEMKSFLISPPVKEEMDAQANQEPRPIPVIITLNESKAHPDEVLEPSRNASMKSLRRERSIAGTAISISSRA